MKPNYHNSIVNLSSAIARSFGVHTTYSHLKAKALEDLEEKRNILLLLVDGLGYNYLKKNAPDSQLRKQLTGPIDSVFLPSTASAVTSIMTGVAPQQHGVTGWFVYLREYGIVSRILPYSNTIDYNLLCNDISNVVSIKSAFESISKDYSLVLPEQIIDSVFTKNLAGAAKRIKYSSLAQFFEKIRNTALQTQSRSYIYGYWPGLDATSHMLGSESEEALHQLHEFDTQLTNLIESLMGTNTKIIITSDHGFNDVEQSNVIYTRDHPEFEECLVMPLCGDTRSVYAYVRPSKVTKFERYVRDKFEGACELNLSADLIEDDWFGLYSPHPRLVDRVGDYTLTFEEGHAIINCFPGFEPIVMTGHHGGVSPDEMIVPLCVIDC